MRHEAWIFFLFCSYCSKLLVYLCFLWALANRHRHILIGSWCFSKHTCKAQLREWKLCTKGFTSWLNWMVINGCILAFLHPWTWLGNGRSSFRKTAWSAYFLSIWLAGNFKLIKTQSVIVLLGLMSIFHAQSLRQIKRALRFIQSEDIDWSTPFMMLSLNRACIIRTFLCRSVVAWKSWDDDRIIKVFLIWIYSILMVVLLLML